MLVQQAKIFVMTFLTVCVVLCAYPVGRWNADLKMCVVFYINLKTKKNSRIILSLLAVYFQFYDN